MLRLAVIRRGVIPASWGGKLKTVVQALAIGLFVLPLSGPFQVAASVVMGAAIVLTVVTGIDYVAWRSGPSGKFVTRALNGQLSREPGHRRRR